MDDGTKIVSAKFSKNHQSYLGIQAQTLSRWKAEQTQGQNLCTWRDEEMGENYWETYSPVVNIISVKILLVLDKIHGLESKSLDFVLAFPQANLDVDIWMELPK